MTTKPSGYSQILLQCYDYIGLYSLLCIYIIGKGPVFYFIVHFNNPSCCFYLQLAVFYWFVCESTV